MTAKKVLKEIEAQNLWMIIGSEKGKVLAEAVKAKKPKRILEVGTYVGYSAILMADALPGEGKIISLELNPSHAQTALGNIKRAGFKEIIEVKVGNALKTIPTLSGTFDFMFIDAVKDEYLDYLKSAEGKLENKAIVVADNVKMYEKSMLDYLEYVRKSGKYQSRIHDFSHDALEISTLKRQSA